MKRAIIIVIALPIISVMAGCATFHRAEIANRAKTELIGISKKELLICAGVPVRSQQIDDIELMTYAGGGDIVGYAGGGTKSSTGGAVIDLDRRYCEVTFILRNGMVEKVNYSGRTGGLLTKGEQCGFVVENCLRDK